MGLIIVSIPIMDVWMDGHTHTGSLAHTCTRIPERGHKQVWLFLAQGIGLHGVCQLASTLREVLVSGTRAGIRGIHKPSNSSLNEWTTQQLGCVAKEGMEAGRE